MQTFRISVVATSSDKAVNIGDKIVIDEIKADYIKETSTGYALIDGWPSAIVVYTVPSGLIVEKIGKEQEK